MAHQPQITLLVQEQLPTAGSVKIDGSNLGSALAGTIAATRLSANTTSGFSIVTYEGTEAVATVAHGLSQAPELILFKNTDSALFWPVYSKPTDATDYLILERPLKEQARTLPYFCLE